MKIKKLLPLAFACVLGLVGCGGTKDPTGCTVNITNKDAITKEWYEDTEVRTLKFAVSPDTNIAQSIKEKKITIESSKPEVVKVDGTILSPMSAGEAVVTVKYYDGIDTVNVSIKGWSKDRWASTLENVLTIDEARELVPVKNNTKKDVTVIGKLTQLTNTSKGQGYITNKEGNAAIQIYSGMISKNGLVQYGSMEQYKPQLNDVVVVKGDLKNYNGTVEFDGAFATVLQLNGEVIPDIEAESIAIGGDFGLKMGETKTLTAKPSPLQAAMSDITWESDNEDVASVDENGKVTANYVGEANISATMGDLFISSKVTVTKGDSIISEVKTPVDGQFYKLALFQANLGKTLWFGGEWDGDRPNLNKESFEAATEIKAVAVEGGWHFMIGDKYLGLKADDKYLIKVDAPNCVFTWDETHGTFTFHSLKAADASKTFFPGTYNSYTTISSCEVSDSNWVNDYVAHFYASQAITDPEAITVAETLSMYVDQSAATLTAAFGRTTDVGLVTWTSSDENVVTVKKSGILSAKVSPKAVGTAVVTAHCGELTANCTVSVVAGLDYGTSEAPLTTAEAVDIIKEFEDKAYSYKPMVVEGVIFTSTYSEKYDNFVIWLDETSSIELYNVAIDTELTAANALRGYTIKFEATAQRYGSTREFIGKGFKVLSLTAPSGEATGLVIDKSDEVLKPEENLKIDAWLQPLTAAGTITWTSSNPAVATVANGVVTAVSEGSTTITAEISGIQKTCLITVDTSVGLSLTQETLLGYDGKANVAYSSSATTKTVGGVTFSYVQIGAYTSGNAGMQMRNKLKDSAGKGTIANTTAMPGKITRVEVKIWEGKGENNNDPWTQVSFGTSADVDGEVVKLAAVKGTYKYTFTPVGTDYTFFKFEVDDAYTYTMYVKEITVFYK